jgi:hypothetical protein
MTRPLRRAHRAIWIALTILLPLLVALSLLSRQEPRGNPRLRWEQAR